MKKMIVFKDFDSIWEKMKVIVLHNLESEFAIYFESHWKFRPSNFWLQVCFVEEITENFLRNHIYADEEWKGIN